MTSSVKQWKSTEPWQGYKKAKEYDEAAFRQTETQKRIKNKVEPILIKKYLQPNQKVLDIGCGTGRITMPLYEHGCHMSAMDNSDGMLRVFQEKHPHAAIDFRIGDVCDIPWEDDTFDACTAITVVRHFPEWKDVVREMRRVVKPGGLLIFEVGSGECLREGNERGIQAGHQLDPTNPCCFDVFLTAVEIRAVLGGLKLKVKDLLSYDMVNNNFYFQGLLDGAPDTDGKYDYWWGNFMQKVTPEAAEELFCWLSETLFIHLPKEWGYNTLVIAEVL